MKDKDLQSSGLLWTVLGSLYQQLNQKTPAATCYKQATKLSGKHTAYISEWSFLGPFVIGKTEVDGDPVESYGGIQQAAKFRYKKGVKFYSELLPGGEIQWSQIKQSGADVGVQVKPAVSWNDLVNSLGSVGITEWQGWLVGELAVNDKDLSVLVQCHGVHTVYVDEKPVTGDVYHRNQYWFSIRLDQGLHTIYLKLRTKVHAQVLCRFKSSKSSFEVIPPKFLPDIWDGWLFSEFLTVPVANYDFSTCLKVSKVMITNLNSKDSEVLNKLDATLYEENTLISPGQIYPIIVNIKTIKTRENNERVIPKCSTSESDWDIEFVLKFTTSQGVVTLPIKLRCRTARQSFLFTFIDHDGSVQHAAAIQPLSVRSFVFTH